MAESFKSILESSSEVVQVTATAARELIFSVYPRTVEVVWRRQGIAGYGTGPKKQTEHFCWIQPNKAHVNLGFNHGAELPDPSDLLEGTGKLFRHVMLRSLEDVVNPDLRDLLVVAVTHRVPQHPAGQS